MGDLAKGGPLGSFAKLQRGTTYKSALLGEPGPYLLGLACIQRNGGFKATNLKTYGGPSDPRILVSPGDLLVSLKDVTQAADLLGAVVRVPDEIQQGRLTQDTVKLVLPENSDLRSFIYWVLRTPQAREHCRSFATGTTNLGLARDDFLSLELPPLTSERRVLLEVLSALDDKIDLNRRMNETLEASARALFRDWFVDFGPTRAKTEGRPAYLAPDLWSLFPDRLGDDGVPEGWGYETLAAVTSEFRRGISPAYTAEGGVRVLNQKCIRDSAVNVAAARRHDPLRKSIAGRLVESGDILVNSTGVGTLGRVAQIWTVEEPTVVDSHVTLVRANPTRLSSYVLGCDLLLRQAEIEALGEGSTGQTELSRQRLGEIRVMVPTPEVQQAFDYLAQSFVNRQSGNLAESRTLAETRDALLPKLMSGAIRVRDAERAVAA